MMQVSKDVLDGLAELVNIGVGRSAGSLSTLTGHHVSLHVPEITISETSKLIEEIPHPDNPYTAVNLDYSGAFNGTAMLMFPLQSAEELFQLTTGESGKTEENEELWRVTLIEIANIIVNAVMGSITNIIGKKIQFHLPEYHENSLIQIMEYIHATQSPSVVVVHAMFQVKEKNISGDVVILLTDQAVEILGEYIKNSITE